MGRIDLFQLVWCCWPMHRVPPALPCGMMEPISNTGMNRMSLEQDIEKLAAQEQRLQLDRFDNAAAWELGTRIKAICEARRVAVTTEVRLAKARATAAGAEVDLDLDLDPRPERVDPLDQVNIHHAVVVHTQRRADRVLRRRRRGTPDADACGDRCSR